MIEIYRDEAGQWRFRIKGLNGEIVAASEGYATKANARRGVEDLRGIMAQAGPVRLRRAS